MQELETGQKIGDVERLTGLSSHAIRVWERRYGVPRPSRSSGRHRLYSPADIDLIRRMDELSRAGMVLAEAARVALREQADRDGIEDPDETATNLLEALLDFDEQRAQVLWKRLSAATSLTELFDCHLSPLLRRLGELWHADEATVAQEHFAATFIRGHIEDLNLRSPSNPEGSIVVVACLPGESHELPALMLAACLRSHGVRAVTLGANTPVDALLFAAVTLGAAVVAIHGSGPQSHAGLLEVARAFNFGKAAPTIVYGGMAFDADSAAHPRGKRLLYGGPLLSGAVSLIVKLTGIPEGGSP